MLNYNDHVCHTLIPSGHTNEESQDPIPHRVYASSRMYGDETVIVYKRYSERVCKSTTRRCSVLMTAKTATSPTISTQQFLTPLTSWATPKL
jgi:hypothetical protein